jgi:hypothetical protein
VRRQVLLKKREYNNISHVHELPKAYAQCQPWSIRSPQLDRTHRWKMATPLDTRNIYNTLHETKSTVLRSGVTGPGYGRINASRLHPVHLCVMY